MVGSCCGDGGVVVTRVETGQDISFSWPFYWVRARTQARTFSLGSSLMTSRVTCTIVIFMRALVLVVDVDNDGSRPGSGYHLYRPCCTNPLSQYSLSRSLSELFLFLFVYCLRLVSEVFHDHVPPTSEQPNTVRLCSSCALQPLGPSRFEISHRESTS